MFDPRDEARDRDEREDGRARVYDERDRADDPRDGLMRDLDLPRGEERELVVDRDHVHELHGEDKGFTRRPCRKSSGIRKSASRWTRIPRCCRRSAVPQRNRWMRC